MVSTTLVAGSIEKRRTASREAAAKRQSGSPPISSETDSGSSSSKKGGSSFVFIQGQKFEKRGTTLINVDTGERTTREEAVKRDKTIVSDVERIRRSGGAAIIEEKTPSGRPTSRVIGQPELTARQTAQTLSQKINEQRQQQFQSDVRAFSLERSSIAKQILDIKREPGIDNIIVSETPQGLVTITSTIKPPPTLKQTFEETDFEKRVRGLQEREQSFFGGEGAKRVQTLASVVTGGGGRPESERSFLGQTSQKLAQTFFFSGVAIAPAIISASEKVAAGIEGVVTGSRKEVGKGIVSGFKEVEKTSFSFLPGGTPITPEGASTGLTILGFGLLKGSVDFAARKNAPIKIEVTSKTFKPKTIIETKVTPTEKIGNIKTFKVGTEKITLRETTPTLKFARLRTETLTRTSGLEGKPITVSRGTIKIGSESGTISSVIGRGSTTQINFPESGKTIIVTSRGGGKVQTKTINKGGKIISDITKKQKNTILDVIGKTEKLSSSVTGKQQIISGQIAKRKSVFLSDLEISGFSFKKGFVSVLDIEGTSAKTINIIDVASQGKRIISSREGTSIELLDPKIQFQKDVTSRKPGLITLEKRTTPGVEGVFEVRTTLIRPKLLTSKEFNQLSVSRLKFTREKLNIDFGKIFKGKKGTLTSELDTQIKSEIKIQSSQGKIKPTQGRFKVINPDVLIKNIQKTQTKIIAVVPSTKTIDNILTTKVENVNINLKTTPVPKLNELKISTDLNLRFKTQTIQQQIPLQITKLKTTLALPTPLTTLIQNFNVPPIPIVPPFVPFIPFFPALPTGGGSRDRRKKTKKGRRVLKFNPSLVAGELKIKGKRPNVLTGFEVRPIPF